MWPQLLNTLSWWQWMILAAVPPAIVALYFLRLKRRPVEVPSTYLWHRSIEDLHVNTIWQRLRRNLLLFLQLLLIFLAMLAVLRPGWRSAKRIGQRSIFLVDNSASMQATDEQPSRLEEAKRQVGELIEQMDRGDVAMLVSFSDSARIEQMFTHNRRQLRRALDSIQPTDRPTSLAEALKVAAGLANPGRTSQDAGDVQVADPLPATLYIFSDGKFPNVSDFSLGNLDPIYMPVGSSQASNVGIVAFNVRRHEGDPTRLQAFARLEFFPRLLFTMDLEYQKHLKEGPVSGEIRGQFEIHRVDLSDHASVVGEAERGQWRIKEAEPFYLIERAGELNVYPAKTTVSLELLLDGELINADEQELTACESTGVAFDLGVVDSGVHVAWTVVNPPQRSKVLVVTPGNEVLNYAFGTSAVAEIAEVTFESPEFLDQKLYQQQAAVGEYDLVIYDRCRPKEMPQANTLFIGSVPPAGKAEQDEKKQQGAQEGEQEATGDVKSWRAGPKVAGPIIIDTDPTHPLMQWIDMGNVDLADATPLEMPPGGSSLMDVQWMVNENASDDGPAFAVAPRDEFEDAVMGFVLIDRVAGEDGEEQTYIGTNWPIRPSFPVFVLNLLHYLGRGQAALRSAPLQPGGSLSLESPTPDKPLQVRTPSGKTITLERAKHGRFTFSGTSELGVYEVRSAGKTLQHFAVNLFHPPESDIRPSSDIKIGRGTSVAAQTTSWETTRRELWKWLLLLGLVVLLVEWYIYHRRVYL